MFTDTSCPAGGLNHAVNLVGYGTLNGKDYYILRNSWGTNWGKIKILNLKYIKIKL